MEREPDGRFVAVPYEPWMCGKLIELGEDGYSMSAAAASLGMSRDHLYVLAKSNPDLAAAKDLAISLAALWWEDRLRAIARGEVGNAATAIFGVKNRAREDWRDMTGLELTGANGGAVETVTHVRREIVDPKN